MFKIYPVGFHFLDKNMFKTMYLTSKERYLEQLNLHRGNEVISALIQNCVFIAEIQSSIFRIVRIC